MSFVLSSFFLSSPNLSRRRLHVYHTSTHFVAAVALVRIWNAGLKRAAGGSLQIQDAKSRQPHHRTTFSGNIFTNKAHIDNRKKLLSSNISFRCPRNMVNFGITAAEIDPVVWGSPANFNGFCVLAALLAAVKQWAPAILCGVEQRAPAIFCRAAIMLGIDSHSSFANTFHGRLFSLP